MCSVRLKNLVSILIILFFFRQFLYSANDINLSGFRDFVKKEMNTWSVPGAAVLLIKDGEVLFSEGFGYRDLARHLPVDPRTSFPIASCTKTFTPFSVGLLVDEGKIEWDRPIRDYYPELMMFDKYVTEHITLRDVLCHRSGLPRHDRVWMYAGLSRDELMLRLRYLEPNHGFRETFQYNNIAYSIAGEVLEKVTAAPWEDFVQKRIFTPLGMEDSSLFLEDIKKSENHSLPYILNAPQSVTDTTTSLEKSVRQIPFHPVNTTGPASCINSNLEDMAKWLMIHLNEGKTGENQLISKDTLGEILSPQISIPPEGEFKAFICEETPLLSYGLGWVIQPFRGLLMLNHSGGIDGFSSFIGLLPKEKAGVIVLTNLHTNMLPYIVAFNYFDRLCGIEPVNRSQKLREKLNALLRSMQGDADPGTEHDIKPSLHPLEDYTGTYQHHAYGMMIVTLKDDQLQISYRDQNSTLNHQNFDMFSTTLSFPSGDLNLRISFAMDKKGDICAFTAPLQPGIAEIRFSKFRD